MRNNLLFLVTFALCAALCLQPSPAAAETMDILELYELAKTRDPVVGKAEARLEAGKADQDIALAALLPRISANGSQRRIWHKVINYGPNDFSGSYEGFGYNIGGQLPILNMPSYLQVSAADAGQKSAEAGLEAARQDLIVRLVDAYIKLLKAQADEKLYRDELARVREILKQAEAFLKAGTGDIIAVYEPGQNGQRCRRPGQDRSAASDCRAISFKSDRYTRDRSEGYPGRHTSGTPAG